MRCAFVFAYAKSGFSHVAAQILFVEAQRILCGLFGLNCGSAVDIKWIIWVVLWKCSGYCVDYLGWFVEVQRILCGLFWLICGSAADILKMMWMFFKCSGQYGFDVAVLWKCSGYFVHIVIFYVIYPLLSCTRKWTLY